MAVLTIADAEIVNKCFEQYLKNRDSLTLIKKHEEEKEIYRRNMVIIEDKWQEIYFRSGIYECYRVFEFFQEFMKYLSSEVRTFLVVKFKRCLVSKICLCTEVVMDYHDVVYGSDEECCASMALIMKIYLLSFKAIDFINCYNKDGYECISISEQFSEYLELIKTKKYDVKLIELLFQVFEVEREDIMNICMHLSDLKFILDSMKVLKFKKPKILSQNINCEEYEISHQFIQSIFISNFIDITEYGAKNTYSLSICENYKHEIMNELVYLNFTTTQMDTEYSAVKMRAYQVLYLYHFVKNFGTSNVLREFLRKEEVLKIPEALRILWNSILDPFLTRKDILSSLGELNPDNEEFLKEAWIWYDKLITKGESKVLSPRSLQHLARFSIRSSLAESFNLPNGVHHISPTFPPFLKNYILIRDS